MDTHTHTPQRDQIGTPISKIEESPFSNFINSLSPINLTKSVHVSQTFGSLSFTSPPSVFTSPHVSLQKDNRFLRRHQVLDLEKSQFGTDEGTKDSTAREISNADQKSDSLVPGDAQGSSETLKDSSEGAELQNCDGGKPYCESKSVTTNGKDTQCETNSSLAIVPITHDPSARSSLGTELSSQNINHDNEEAGCDWQSLIACNSDLFIFDSPDVIATSKGSLRNSHEDVNVFDSLLSRFPPNQACDMQNLVHAGPSKYNEAHEATINSTQPSAETEMQQIDQASENQEISANEFLASDSGQEPGKEAFGKLHRGMRRRCLTFELPRNKNSMEGVLLSRSLSTLQAEEKQLSCSRQTDPSAAGSSRCILPGIGLHLNALAAASKDCGIPNQAINTPTPQDSLRNDEGPAENVLESAEDFSQASLYASYEELNSNSPKKKRKKADSVGEGESCKRCNCKKSKCLKLYCECFAAGVYCVEPCSCQDCFNKPIHEETVLATRKQIESRNPLAFAPKVIRTVDSSQELGEDSNGTPASARHKRGCNCKKSNCLKKYCECYQGGVGCSINCRCEGCKNAFGRKDGSTLIATEPEKEKLQPSEKSVMDKTLNTPGIHDDEDRYCEFAIPETPSRLYSRSSVPLATSSKGKPPRYSLGTNNSSSSLLTIEGVGRSTFLRSHSRIEKHYQNASTDEIPSVLQNVSPSSSELKNLSPNSKRISPPHHANGQGTVLRSSRKLILQSIPSFPSLSPRR